MCLIRVPLPPPPPPTPRQRELLGQYDAAGLGICRRTFEPVTSRTTEFYCNPAHAHMTNLPVMQPRPHDQPAT